MAISNLYKTTDGKIFESLDEAKAHENSTFMVEKTKTEVKDLLNQILIKSKHITSDNYLVCLSTYITRILKSEEEASYNEEQYYNSNCY